MIFAGLTTLSFTYILHKDIYYLFLPPICFEFACFCLQYFNMLFFLDRF
ncbi:hypothetical protein CCY16_00518 [Wolbachia endosymbiont of Wuchereria bancrofti]|nr:hypothetical protein CCY16_00518 [Wolbachia endosymbiont of Wuchereria bancrofti]